MIGHYEISSPAILKSSFQYLLASRQGSSYFYLLLDRSTEKQTDSI